MKQFVFSDLARECCPGPEEGVDFWEKAKGEVVESSIAITSDAAARRLGKGKGRYITFSFPDPVYLAQQTRQELVEMVAQRLSELLCGVERVLVVGLGNRRITCDALGPGTVDRITVTNHLKSLDPSLFDALGRRAVTALVPGVLGDTGMEAASLVEKALESGGAQAVVAVDALAARAVDRLGCTIQLTNGGIAPGSGVGNHRKAISEAVLGVPVVAVGVPTVTSSATLVWDALEKAGVEEVSEDLHRVLENGKSFFVTPKQSDATVEALCEILAQAIDLALERDV